MQRLSPAELLILQCCANPEKNLVGQIAALSSDEQNELLELALRTRAVGLLYRASQGLDSAFGARLAEIAKRYSLHNLQTLNVLIKTADILNDSGLEPVALKGASLAFDVYPDAQLRPLRDIDLLLEPSAASEAQDLLLSREAYDYAERAGRYGLEYSHQLPELVHKPSGVIIEIHHRLNSSNWQQEPAFLSAMRASVRPLQFMGTEVLVPSASCNALHLLEHATLHHVFANGPLVLADFHFLARQLDLSKLEGDAALFGLARALELIGQIAKKCGAEWPDGETGLGAEVDPQIAAAAMATMLSSNDEVAQFQQKRRVGGGLGQSVGRAFRPNPHELSKFSGKASDSHANWLGYPAWLLEKGSRYLRGRFFNRQAERYLAYAQLVDWLEGGAGSA